MADWDGAQAVPPVARQVHLIESEAPLIKMRISKITIAAAIYTIISAAASTGWSMVNNLPATQTAEEKGAHLERQEAGLNQVIGTQFSGIAAFPYWNHVGSIGMGSGIYVGDGYVLTSTHVGCYPFRLNDGSHYEPDYASWTVLKNADGTRSDLAVFRIQVPATSALAKLGRIPLSNSRSSDSPVLLVGTGFTQGAQPLTLSGGGSVFSVLGYRVVAHRSTAWGLNRASQSLDQPVRTGRDFSTRCFTTQFERTSFAGQAADGDSGGAAFVYNREQNRWELGGCIIAVSQQQANVAFGCRTFLGDVGTYASQIPGTPTSLAYATTTGARRQSAAIR